ncbi:MAG: hypothetical protein KQH59_06550 [Desulfobulbaceae bacterium]|nr:hypothetical protein [Desulfobulbaceae bacterium]
MSITREMAGELAADHLRHMIEERLSLYLKSCDVRDSLPGGSFYSGPGGAPDNYWCIEVPDLFGQRPIQLDGERQYLAISKETGKVSFFSTLG